MPHRTTASEDVLVAPRYLAGTTGTDPVAPLLNAAPGWSRALVGPDPYYASSCQRLRAARRDSEWTFTYAADPLGMPDWSAHFDRTTPDEVLAPFTERLIDGMDTYFADHLSGGPLHTGQTPASIFAEHGWEPLRGTRPSRTLAPDEHAAFHIRTSHADDSDELRHRGAATWKITSKPRPGLPADLGSALHRPHPTTSDDRRRPGRGRPRARCPPGAPHPRGPSRSRRPAARSARRTRSGCPGT